MTRLLLSAALGVALTAGPARADDQRYVFGFSEYKCWSFLSDGRDMREFDRHGDRRLLPTGAAWVGAVSWAMGYVSGGNVAAAEDHHVFDAIKGPDQFVDWMENWCRKHPAATIAQASIAFYEANSSKP